MKLSEFQSLPAKRVDLGHTEISYRRVGEGEPILFIHGWPLTSATYRKLIPGLSERYECILPDSPGLGASSWSEETDFHFKAQAKTWERFVEALELESYSLAAHDTGATVARFLARAQGSRVKKFVIFDTEIPHHRPKGAEFGLRMLGFPGAQWMFRRLMKRRGFIEGKYGFHYAYVDKSLFNDEFYEAYVTPLIDDDRRWQGAMRYVRAVDWAVVDELAELHGELECPVLLIWGERDRFFPLAEARGMQGQFKNCEGLVVLPEAGLMSYEEKPAEAVEAMLSFLAC